MLVLPDDPVTPTTVSSPASSRSTTGARQPAERGDGSSTTHVRTPHRPRDASTAAAPAATARRDEVVPVHALADDGDEQRRRAPRRGSR